MSVSAPTTPTGGVTSKVADSLQSSSHTVALPSLESKNSTREVMIHPQSLLPIDSHARSKTFSFFSLIRPHMRAFHLSWSGFFLAFLGWFAFAPLMPTIKEELGLSKSDVASANIASVSSTIVIRIIVGPLCDRFGPRKVMAGLLYAGSIPVMLGGTINSATGLIIIRFCIGIIGGVFVPCQMWTTGMFSTNIVGTANSIAGGWGNLGGGAAYLFMPAVFNILRAIGASADVSWRVAMVVPGFICAGIATVIVFFSDDWPTDGMDSEYEAQVGCCGGPRMVAIESSEKVVVPASITKPKMKAVTIGDMGHVIGDYNVIIMMAMYAGCFGIELAMNNAIGTYFYDNFKKNNCDPATDSDECRIMSQTTSGLIASLFGLMNLFARATGGILSDNLFANLDLYGRLLAQLLCLTGEGLFLLAFSSTSDLSTAILLLILFSICTQAAEGSTFAIVPYVNVSNIGSVAGLTGAGGNIGAVIWSTILKSNTNDPRAGFRILAYCVISIASLALVMSVQDFMLVKWLSQTQAKPASPAAEVEVASIT